jgi:hypothetical protein
MSSGRSQVAAITTVKLHTIIRLRIRAQLDATTAALVRKLRLLLCKKVWRIDGQVFSEVVQH